MYRLRINIHSHVDKRKRLSIRPSVDTFIHTHTFTCTRTYIHTRTHTLTRLLEKGVRIWEGIVLCIRPSLAIGGHTGIHTLWHRLECARGGGGEGEGDKVVAMQLHVYIHRAMYMCVW